MPLTRIPQRQASRGRRRRGQYTLFCTTFDAHSQLHEARIHDNYATRTLIVFTPQRSNEAREDNVLVTVARKKGVVVPEEAIQGRHTTSRQERVQSWPCNFCFLFHRAVNRDGLSSTSFFFFLALQIREKYTENPGLKRISRNTLLLQLTSRVHT